MQRGGGRPHRACRGTSSRTRRRVAAAFSFLFCLCLMQRVDASTQERRADGRGTETGIDSTLYRVSASRLSSMLENGERVVYLEGGVRIEHQAAVVTSESGKQFPERRLTILTGDVRAIDGTMEMFSDVGRYYGWDNVVVMEGGVRLLDQGWEVLCERARYERGKRAVILTGDLVLSDSTRVMYADSLYYDRVGGTADATGHVVLLDEAEDYSISGRHVSYRRHEKVAFVDERPILNFDLRSEEKGRITSRTMRFDVDREIGIAVDDVRMVKGETRANCDSAAIFSEEGYIQLYGRPSATNGPSAMTGRRMTVWYNDQEVERIELPSSGRLTEAPDEASPWREDSWIEGDSVVIYLSGEKVDSVRIVGDSKAMYYPVEKELEKVSNNYSSGDTMFFVFERQDLDHVRISGRAVGTYNFLNLAEGETIDSLAAAIDSSLRYRDFKLEAERVEYKAGMIEYFARSNDLMLRGDSQLDYQNKTLSAERINFNADINVLEAFGKPVLDEAGQKMYGADMGYDMESEAGVVVDGSTKYEQGYYRGEEIFMVGKDILKVYRSVYTTCDLKRPHYSMRSKRMKVYIDDMIVSGPIVLHVGEIPVFYLPYMANSLRKDRHSGILRPNFDIGIDSREGRFLRGLGYYWATNDYTDFTLRTDFNERRSFRAHLINRYKVRYKLDGNVKLNFYRDLRNYTNEWTIESAHSQRFGPTASLRSDLRFVSSDNAQIAIDRSEDVRKFVDRRIYSSASFNKSWGGTRLSLAANRNQILNTKSPTQVRVKATMPSFSINLPRTSLWFGDRHEEGDRSLWERALGSIMFSPNLSASRQTEESDAREKATLSAKSSAGFSQQHKLMFINFSPSVVMNWSYFKVLYDRINADYADVVSKGTGSNYTNEFTMRLSSGVGTTLYGTFYPELGPLHGIRHTINPTISYSYTPKLSEKQAERQSVSYSVRNVIDLKLMQGGKETKKNNVVSWLLNGGYNPKLPKEKSFSNIKSSLRAAVGNPIGANVIINHTYDPNRKEIVSRSFSAGLGLNLSGSFSYPLVRRVEERERIEAARGEFQQIEETTDGEAVGSGRRGKEFGWSMNLDYSYTSTGLDPNKRTDSKLDIGGQIQLTEGWKVTYHGYYNVDFRQFTEQTYSLKRDLHCWEASFTHRRFGNEWSYYFQIAVKAHPEIMYERGTRAIRQAYRF